MPTRLLLILAALVLAGCTASSAPEPTKEVSLTITNALGRDVVMTMGLAPRMLTGDGEPRCHPGWGVEAIPAGSSQTSACTIRDWPPRFAFDGGWPNDHLYLAWWNTSTPEAMAEQGDTIKGGELEVPFAYDQRAAQRLVAEATLQPDGTFAASLRFE